MTSLETRPATRAGVTEAPADCELLARWCDESDATALELLVRRHGGMVLGVCRRVLGTAADADDAFQATFLILVQKARSLDRPEQVAGWLHAVALRVARKARANRARRHEREGPIVDILDPADTDLSPELRDLRRALDEELDRLPEKYRLPIVLCELEGRTLDEAAGMLGWPKGTVAGRLSRGRELLRQRLSRRGMGLPLFLVGPLPGVGTVIPSDPLVAATVTTATGGGGPGATLAQAVLADGLRRRLGLLAITVLSVILLALLGWQARPASAGPPAPSPAANAGGCSEYAS